IRFLPRQLRPRRRDRGESGRQGIPVHSTRSGKTGGLARRVQPGRSLGEERHRRRPPLMARLYLFAEGTTEQTFADTVLKPHLASLGVYLHRPVLIAHARKKGKVHRGGG